MTVSTPIRFLLSTLFLLTVLSFGKPVSAGGEPWQKLDAQPIIDRCWQLSEEDRDSGVTSRMRNSTFNTIDCLKSAISENTSAIIANYLYSKEEIDKDLSAIIKGNGRFYWNLNNSHKGCRSSCGTMYHTFHAAEIAGRLEKILRDVIEKRNEYGV